MHPTLITHYRHRLKRKKSRILRYVLVSRKGILTTMNTITHYTSEIKQQAKVFAMNTKNINRFNN